MKSAKPGRTMLFTGNQEEDSEAKSRKLPYRGNGVFRIAGGSPSTGMFPSDNIWGQGTM